MNHYTNKENLSNIGIENILQRFSSFSSFKTHWVKKYLNYRELVYKTNSANLYFYKKMFLPFYLWFIFATGICIRRSSRPEVFCVKGLLRNFTEFTGKHLCQSLFFNKVAGLRPATLLKKRLWHRFLWILWNFWEHLFLKNTTGGCFCIRTDQSACLEIKTAINEKLFWD